MNDRLDPDAWTIHPQAWSRVAPADADPVETREWLEAFRAVLEAEGRERATFLLRKLLDEARSPRVPLPPVLNTPYCNTIALADQPQYPGNLEIESAHRRRSCAGTRWRWSCAANRAHPELGGHIATYASIADLFEVGFNHFFRGHDRPGRARRPRLLPAARRARRLRARLPRRASERREARALPARDRRRAACRRTATRG